MESNLSLENLSRRYFLTASALTGLSLFGLKGLEGQDFNFNLPENTKSKVVETKNKQKTPEDYGIEMNSYYNVGLFLCNKIIDDKKLKGLESFEGINKGLTSVLNKEGKSELVGIPIYKKDEKLYLVIYNPKEPKEKNRKIGLYVSEVIEEKGIKFIDGKPYEVRIERGEIVDIKLSRYEIKKEGMFYDLLKRKQDIIVASKFEEVIRKGPFELNGNHRAFSVEKLNPGLYSALLEIYNGNEPYGCLPGDIDFKIEE